MENQQDFVSEENVTHENESDKTVKADSDQEKYDETNSDEITKIKMNYPKNIHMRAPREIRCMK